jgi:L-threonylcarbamoyladenylate synthase
LKTRVVFAPEGLVEAARLLAAAELVALPTETVYGLAAAALNSSACAKIFEAKGRPLSDPLIVHLPDIEWLARLARPGKLAMSLASEFWPGPLTMVLPRTNLVPDLVTSGQSTVAVRMSAHSVFRQIAEMFAEPLAAPSANRFGRVSPTTAGHVVAELGGRIPLIVDGGPCSHGLESTIVRVREKSLEILRHGPVLEERLAEFGKMEPSAGRISVPGAMKSHYAPRTPLVIAEASDSQRLKRGDWPPKTGLLLWSGSAEGFEAFERLSATGDLREAAANFYGAVRRLDESGMDLIVAEAVPETGLGVAIMERLRKAAARG